MFLLFCSFALTTVVNVLNVLRTKGLQQANCERCCQKELSQAGRSNYIPQFTVGWNYLSLPEIPASGNKILNCGPIHHCVCDAKTINNFPYKEIHGNRHLITKNLLVILGQPKFNLWLWKQERPPISRIFMDRVATTLMYLHVTFYGDKDAIRPHDLYNMNGYTDKTSLHWNWPLIVIKPISNSAEILPMLVGVGIMMASNLTFSRGL